MTASKRIVTLRSDPVAEGTRVAKVRREQAEHDAASKRRVARALDEVATENAEILRRLAK